MKISFNKYQKQIILYSKILFSLVDAITDITFMVNFYYSEISLDPSMMMYSVLYILILA